MYCGLDFTSSAKKSNFLEAINTRGLEQFQVVFEKHDILAGAFPAGAIIVEYNNMSSYAFN